MKSRILSLMLFLSLFIQGCTGGPGLLSNKTPVIVTPRADTVKALKTVGDNRYSVDIPEGWVIETTGEYQNFGFRAYDPEVPSRTIFYYGTMSPWLKSEGAKEFWAWYAATGYSDARLYADAPVLYDASVEGLYNQFESFARFAQAYGINHDFPVFGAFEVLESLPTQTAMGPYALDESTLRLKLEDNGPIEALVTATLVDAMAYPAQGIDAGYYTAYRVSGILAPADDFLNHQDRLTEALASFRFSEAYIEEGVKQIQWSTDQARKMHESIEETTRIINDVWKNRQKTYDAANQKFSDYLRGYSRVQDPSTGKTYQVDQDFVNEYFKDPTQYNNANITQIPDGSEAYSQPVSGTMSIAK